MKRENFNGSSADLIFAGQEIVERKPNQGVTFQGRKRYAEAEEEE